MAVLKYKNGEGQFVTLTNYTVQPIVPVQTTGTSLTDVMSQKAVSDEVNSKVNESDLNEKIASAITNDNDVKDAINSQVSDAISGDNTVKEAVDEAIADAIANASAVTEAVEDVVDEKLTAYTSTEDADLRYAFKEHTHEVSAITGFDDAVAESVKTEITNNNSAITESINSVVEKYIYGEGGASQDAEVVTTDNLSTTLADYAKSEDIPTDLSAFTNSPKYVKESEVNDLVADAIAESETVYSAVTEAITSAITDSETVKDAIEDAVSNKADISAVTESINQATSGKVETSDYNTYTAATENALGTKFAGVNYVKDDNKIYFYDNASNTGTALAYVDTAVAGGVSSAVLGSGSTDGTITLSINGALQDTVSVPGLGTAAFLNTGTTDGTIAMVGHTHDVTAITNFDIAVESAITANSSVSGAVESIVEKSLKETTITNEIISAVTASTEFVELSSSVTTISGDVTTISGDVITISGDIITVSGDVSTISGNVTTISGDIITVSGDVTTISGDVTTISGNVITLSGDVSTVSGIVDNISADTVYTKAFVDFCSGHNTVSTLANIPTDKRLVIATISSSTNELSLSGNALTDGYEIHVIVTNSGEEAATVTLPSSGGYISVGDAISIEAGATGEINIISDGTNKYVRGV